MDVDKSSGNGEGRNEGRYQSLVQSVDGIFWESRADTFEFTYVSPQCEKILGYPPSDWIGDPSFWKEHIHQDDRERAVRYCHDKASKGENHTFEYRMISSDGEVVWLRDTVTVIQEEGDPVLLRGVMTDITEIKEAERERERERRDKEALINGTSDLIWSVAPDMTLMAANEAFIDANEKLMGVRLAPGDDLLQAERVGEEEAARWERYYRAAFGGESFTVQNIPLYLEEITWWETSFNPIREGDELVGAACYSRNITEQKVAQEEIRKAKERYDIVSRATNDMVWDWDLESDRVRWNQTFVEILGYDTKRTSIDWWEEHLHPEDRDRVVEKIRHYIEEGREKWDDEYRFRCAGGNYLYIYDRGYLVFDEQGEAVRMIGSMQDVTERKEYEQQLEQLSLVASKTTDVIIITDADDRITWVNKAFEELTGYTFEEAAGENPGELLQGPDTDQETVKRLAAAVENRESIQEVILNYTKEGEKYWLDMTINPIFSEEGECTDFIAIEKDVTQQKEHEERIREALKEKETLLAEIHHRVKNNLAVVSGMMQLQAYEEQNEEIRSKLLDSVVRIGSMAAIHEQLYQANSFSQLNFSENLKNLVRNIIDTIQNQVEVEVEFELDPLNLNVNQAIPGSLIVNEVVTNSMKHAFRSRDRGLIRVILREEDNNIRLYVSDDGVGLPEDFETEESQTLGLNLIDTLAEQLEAEYRYEAADEGCEFSLSFEKSELKGIGSLRVE